MVRKVRKGRRGRPRAFDTGRALDAAMRVFWKKGYEGASLTELTRAMGINRPSLYAAFGNKQSLFRQALDRYAQGPASYVREAIAEPTARGVVERLLRGTIDLLTDPKNPRGCLAVHGALACGSDAESVRRRLASQRAAGEAAIRERLEAAAATGDLPRSADPASLARYLAAVVSGMAVQATGGATRQDLVSVAETALRALPA